jgi:RES domain-containing protein
MFVYRIAKTRQRATDLSGTGAYRTGGRWNNKGTYLLYTSENSSLAFLETLVHQDVSELPPKLFIVQLAIKKSELIYTLPDKNYPANWLKAENSENKTLGDGWMKVGKYLAIKVRSAVNQHEYNYLLNPLFPNFSALVSILNVTAIPVDDRLIKK